MINVNFGGKIVSAGFFLSSGRHGIFFRIKKPALDGSASVVVVGAQSLHGTSADPVLGKVAAKKKLLAAAAVTLLLTTHSLPAANAPGAALMGQVSSAEEGAMEGVLVSAKSAGSTVTFTVVSDQQGRYQFPAAKLAPGQYSQRIRAAGYDEDFLP